MPNIKQPPIQCSVVTDTTKLSTDISQGSKVNYCISVALTSYNVFYYSEKKLESKCIRIQTLLLYVNVNRRNQLFILYKCCIRYVVESRKHEPITIQYSLNIPFE